MGTEVADDLDPARFTVLKYSKLATLLWVTLNLLHEGPEAFLRSPVDRTLGPSGFDDS
jgi:hypothetical protein